MGIKLQQSLSISPIPFSTGFSTSMTELTPSQYNELVEQFVDLVVDNMDMKTLVQYVYDDLREHYEQSSQNELKDAIDNFDEELWDQLVDNVTTVTYGLAEGETLSFPVHSPTK